MNTEQLITVIVIGVINGAVSIYASVIVLKAQIGFIKETLKRHDNEIVRIWSKF